MEHYKNLSLENLPNEEWKDVVGYEGLYQVSNLGRVKCLPRCIGGSHNRYFSKVKIMKVKPNNNGYLQANLHKDGFVKRISIHRLVAIAFIPLVKGKEYIDHINAIRTDNRVENLRWCTHQENDNFPLAIENKKRIARVHITKEWREKQSKKLKEYYKKEGSIEKSSLITKRLWSDNEEYANKIRETKKSQNSINKSRHTSLCKKVLQFDLEGKFIAEYFSASEAQRITKINKITACCRGERNKAGNYIWKYKL